MHTSKAPGTTQELGSRRIWILKNAVIALLVVCAAVSLWGGVGNALAPGRSQDFQWSGARMVLRHVDPWQDYLLGDPAHAIYQVQIPNYLPLMYLLLAPLGLMSMEHATMAWAALNVLFGLASGIICARFYELDKAMCVVLVALVALSTPMRNTLGNGQQSLLVLFFWVLALCHAPRVRAGFTVGLSYFKYSFAPPVFFFLLLRLGYRAALWSLVPAATALAIVYLWLGGSLAHLGSLAQMLFAPLKVATNGYDPNPGANLMDALAWVIHGMRVAAPIADLIVYALPLVLAAVLLVLFTRRGSGVAWEVQIALLAVLSLTLFKHHGYDSVVLLLPMACCLRYRPQPAARWGAALVCYPWYGDRLFRATGHQPHWSFLIDLAALVAIGAALSQLRRFPRETQEA